MPGLAALFDQKSPFEHYVFGNRQDPLREHWTYLVRQPIEQFRAPASLGDQLYAETYFRESDRTDVKTFERLRRDEACNLGLRPGTTQFR